LLTWAFTFPGTPYFAGYRALTTNGIDLPVLGAFKLLGRLSGTRLPLTSSGAQTLDELLKNGVRDQPDIDGMATRDGDTVQVLIWNYHDDLVAVPNATVHVTVDLPASIGANVRVSHLRVDETHGNAYTTWLAQGMPAMPSNTQIRALQRAMLPELLVPERTVTVPADRALTLDFELPRFGVSLLTLRAATSADAGSTAGSGGAGTAPEAQGDGCACRNTPGGTPVSSVPPLGALIALMTLGRRRAARRALRVN